jgi:hypothetical protein
VLRRQALLRGGLALLLVAWAVVSLLGLPPLHVALAEEATRTELELMAAAGVLLYAVAAARYWRLYRRRPSVMLVAVITAVALLAEAMVAVSVAHNWHASWWEWHLLMAVAFAFVAYSAQVQYAREGSWSALFHGIYLQETIQQLRQEHSAALEALVTAIQQQAASDNPQPIARVVAALAARFDLTEGQAQVLERAAEALMAEREQIRRLQALVAVGAESRVIVDERELLERGVELTGQALRPDALQVGLVEQERLVFPASLRVDGAAGEAADGGDAPAVAALRSLEPVEAPAGGGGRLVLPLTVKDRPAGVLDVRRARGGFADRDRWLLRALASQLSSGWRTRACTGSWTGCSGPTCRATPPPRCWPTPPRRGSAGRSPRSRCCSPTCAGSPRSPSRRRRSGWSRCSTSTSAGRCRCCWPTAAR